MQDILPTISEVSPLMDKSVNANNLGAGQKQNFETFTLVPSDEIAKYQAATFKVVEVSMF